MNALDIEQHAADWLAKRVGTPPTSAAEAEFETWLRADLAHRIAYIRLEAVWKETGRLQALAPASGSSVAPSRGAWLDTAALPLALQSLRVAEETRGKPVARRARFMAIAASILMMAIAAGWAGYTVWSATGRYTTRVGATQTVPLSDGSQITLNTNTRLHVALQESARLVELERGEAYFEVAKDPARPFIVKAAGKRVVAIGTKFSVRRNDNDVEVVVTEGAVRVEESQTIARPATELPKLLHAGAIARAGDAGIIVRNEPAERLQNHLSWRNGYLVFRATPLAQAVAEFNRYSTRKIVIADPAITAIEVGGSFKSDSSEVFLWMLRNGFPIEIDTQGEEVILRAR